MGRIDRIVTVERLVVVQAVVGFSYDGREVRPGELITMRPLDAAVAHRHGLISLTRHPTTSNGSLPPPLPLPPSPEPKRRRYRRRDLDAEQ